MQIFRKSRFIKSTANRPTSFLNIVITSTRTYWNWLVFKLNRATPVSWTTSAPVRLISASAADKNLYSIRYINSIQD